MTMGRALIVGGGVIGLSIAYEIARRGLDTTIVDGPMRESAASWASAGILTPARLDRASRPEDRLRATSLERIERWAGELREACGVDAGFIRSGSLHVAAGSDETAELARAVDDWRDQGLDPEPVPVSELTRLEPALSPELDLAYRLPGEAQVRPPRYLAALARGCAARGVAIRRGVTVESLESAAGDGPLRVERAAIREARREGAIAADHFVVAAGAWSGELVRPFYRSTGRAPELRPIRGQIVLLRGPNRALARIVWRGDSYLVPRGDGRVLVGSTMEDAGFDARTTLDGVSELLAFAAETAPGLRDHAVEACWAGLRPRGGRKLPWIERVPGTENLYLAAGHHRAGFELSAGTALAVADLVTGAEPSFPMGAFSSAPEA